QDEVLLLALVLNLVLFLNCFRLETLSKDSNNLCVTTQETCGYKKDTVYRRCIRMANSMIFQSSPNIKAKCCQTDLCNRSADMILRK
uniref:Snake toxin/toxin-like domain-containing protein n=1 Tax=Cyprinus carpio TaxID=7962 RepID=A0A8C1SN27_CYPCA